MGSILAVLEAFVQDPVVLESQKTRRRIKHEERGRNLAGSARNQLIGRNNPENNFDPFDEGREDLLQEKRIIKRVKEKLDGCDFGNNIPLSVNQQVDQLISQAQDMENLCQHYQGWCLHF